MTRSTEIDEENKKEIQELVSKCGQGDREALRVFFNRYSDDIYNFPLKVFGLDEDQASEFFLYAFERLKDGQRFGSFKGNSSFRTWFYTVIRNLVIDWMRTVKEINVVNSSRAGGESDNSTNWIETIADYQELRDEDDPVIEAFYEKLSGLDTEQKLVFKLVYLYYLQIETGDLEDIRNLTKKEPAVTAARISELRSFLAEKEIANKEAEEKLTAIYVSMTDIRTRRDRIKLDYKSNPADTALLNEIEKYNRLLDKKREQRNKLLEKKSKGHFIVRTPYKYVAEILNMSEGRVSIHMTKISDILEADPAIRKIFQDNEE